MRIPIMYPDWVTHASQQQVLRYYFTTTEKYLLTYFITGLSALLYLLITKYEVFHKKANGSLAANLCRRSLKKIGWRFGNPKNRAPLIISTYFYIIAIIHGSRSR